MSIKFESHGKSIRISGYLYYILKGTLLIFKSLEIFLSKKK